MSLNSSSGADPVSRNLPWKKRFRLWWAEYQWVVIGIAGLLAFSLGYVGFSQLNETAKVKQTSFDLVYLSLQLFRINSEVPPGPKPWQLEAARTLATTITLIAAVKALMLLFRERFQRFRLRRWKEHIVICGLGRKGRQLAADLVSRGEQIVVIEGDEGNDEIENFRERGVIVFTGNATSLSILKKARVEHARYVFAVGGDDRINLEIGLITNQLMTGKNYGSRPDGTWQNRAAVVDGGIVTDDACMPSSPTRCCFVHLIDMELRDLLDQHRVFSRLGGQVAIKCFNIFANAARRLFLDHPPDTVMRALGQEAVHLLIVGFGHMGQGVALQAARIGHYANGKKVQITVVDKLAEKKGAVFFHNYPMFSRICDIAFIGLDTDDVAFLDGSFLDGRGGRDSVTRVIICLEQESAGLVCGLNLLRIFAGQPKPLFIRMNAESELLCLLRKEAWQEDNDQESGRVLQSFGSVINSCSSGMVLNEEQDRMARKVHAAYVQIKRERGGNPATDKSMHPWVELDEDLKESNRQQTEHIGVKLRAIDCDIRPLEPPRVSDFAFTKDEIELLARMEHARWNAERHLAGWTYGQKKSIEHKISPYLVAWEELTEEIKEYDRNTVRDIPAILAEIGQMIVRKPNE